jgi:hypothetical protein
MKLFNFGWPWNAVLFIAFMFVFDLALWLACEWLERRRLR